MRADVERGTGMLGTIAGVSVFLALLSVALQVLLQLATTSTVTAAAYDAARQAATAGRPPDAHVRAAAEERARVVLGGLAEGTTFEWDTTDPDTVGLRVRTPAPRLLLPVVSGALGIDHIDRTVTVRREELRP